MELSKITRKDLLELSEEDPLVTTKLSFSDDSWMNYVLNVTFRTEKYGVMTAAFEYCGCTSSTMEVRNKDGEIVTYNFSSEVFQKHIVKFVERHIKNFTTNWGYSFCGGCLFLDFFNEVLEKGEITENEPDED